MLTLTEKPKGKEKSNQAPRLPFYIAKRKECSLWREREREKMVGVVSTRLYTSWADLVNFLLRDAKYKHIHAIHCRISFPDQAMLI